MPSRIKTDPLQFHYLERNRVPYSKVATVSHLLKTSLSLIFKVTLLYGIIEIVRYKRSDWQPLTYGLSTISDLPYYYMLGLGISICLEGGYTVAMIASCLVFKLDFVPVMTHP